jgi:hypothetical protein
MQREIIQNGGTIFIFDIIVLIGEQQTSVKPFLKVQQFRSVIMMVIYRHFGERNGRKCVDNVSSLSSIGCFWNFTAFGPGVRGCGVFSSKNVLLQKFVIQPKRYRQTCTQSMNAEG